MNLTREQAAALAQHVITRRVTPLADYDRRWRWFGAWLKARQAEDVKAAELARVKT